MGETGVDIEHFERRICGILRASHSADGHVSNTTTSTSSTGIVVPAIIPGIVSGIVPVEGSAIMLIVDRCMLKALRDELEGF